MYPYEIYILYFLLCFLDLIANLCYEKLISNNCFIKIKIKFYHQFIIIWNFGIIFTLLKQPETNFPNFLRKKKFHQKKINGLFLINFKILLFFHRILSFRVSRLIVLLFRKKSIEFIYFIQKYHSNASNTSCKIMYASVRFDRTELIKISKY